MNTEQSLLTLPTDAKELMEKWLPRVRFELPSEIEPRRYLIFLHSFFVEFVRKVEPKRVEWNKYNAFAFGYENGGEGGMGGSTFKAHILTIASYMPTTAPSQVKIMLRGKGS